MDKAKPLIIALWIPVALLTLLFVAYTANGYTWPNAVLGVGVATGWFLLGWGASIMYRRAT